MLRDVLFPQQTSVAQERICRVGIVFACDDERRTREESYQHEQADDGSTKTRPMANGRTAISCSTVSASSFTMPWAKALKCGSRVSPCMKMLSPRRNRSTR